jgi:two-component system nitrogen regulation sensor histidine kinase NtrY
MISKNLNINLILRVLLIFTLSILQGYLIAADKSLRISIICFLAIVILTVNLISFLNATNRKIKYFFDSVRNDDSNLFFPVEEKNKTVREIYKNMNRVNEQIRKLKIAKNQQELYFHKILELLATGIITYNNKGFIHHANSSAKRLLSIEVLTHLQQIERIDKKLFRTIKSLKPFERQLVAVNTNQGEIQLLLKSTSFGSDENEMTILSMQDIKHELDEKEVDAWMKLIRVLMHEIMNSITPITSLSESLSKIYLSGDKLLVPGEVTEKNIASTLQGLNVIKEQGKGLLKFVESYRKLTRIPRPEMKSFKVSTLFSRVKILIDSFEKGSNIDISYSINKPDIEIIADENLISLVLINLIKNAIEANENNPDCKIKMTAKTDISNHPEICVMDNGPGIITGNLEEIFIPFFTTRENGSGIGLSISKQIMGAHGGSLKVHSIPDKETVFCLRFQN